jgi:hypothetical protein
MGLKGMVNVSDAGVFPHCCAETQSAALIDIEASWNFYAGSGW